MGNFYHTAYRPHRAPDGRHRGRIPRNKATTWRYPDMGRKSLPWLGQGRLLDFGCGGGSFLERMHRQNWQVMGIDASARAVERIRSELGLRAVVGSLPHTSFRPDSFEFITI